MYIVFKTDRCLYTNVVSNLRSHTFKILIFLIILAASCKSGLQEEDFDDLKTTELIIHLLKVEDNYLLSSSCISEGPRAISTPMTENFKGFVKKNLNITDTIHLNKQMRLHSDFKISNTLAGDLKLLTEESFENLQQLSLSEGLSFWDWLDENCQNGYLSISKPIFNETYDLAYVQKGTVCGRLCGGGGAFIFKFENGIWKEIKILSSWVS